MVAPLLAALLLATTQQPPKPAVEYKLGAAIHGLVPSRERPWIFVLNSTANKLQRYDVAQRQFDPKSLDLPQVAEGITLSPDGKTLVAYVSAKGHLRTTPDNEQARESGRILVIDPTAFEIKTEFPVDVDPWDAVVNDYGQLFLAGGSGPAPPLVRIDVAKKAITAVLTEVLSSTSVRLASNGRKLYYGTNVHPEGLFHALPLQATSKLPAVPYKGPDPFTGGRFEIAPDGAHLVAVSGLVFRLSGEKKDDLKRGKDIDPHAAAWFDKEGGLLYTLGEAGALKAYTYPGFVLKKTVDFKVPCYRMLVDAKTRTLMVATTEPSEQIRLARGKGDLRIYDLPEVPK